MKILVKIWGSLIAPKDKEGIDYNYLSSISYFFGSFFYDFMIVHWTWNIWHWWVKTLVNNCFWCDRKELLKKDYFNWRRILDKYFWQVDKFFGYKRLKIQDFLEFPYFEGKTIVGWEVLSTGDIISSDDIFQMVLKNSDVDLWLILTDVDWVLDKNWNVIKQISKKDLSKIDFWAKDWDVTGWMKAKVEKLLGLNKKIVICNWKDLVNIARWINLWIWNWTVLT